MIIEFTRDIDTEYISIRYGLSNREPWHHMVVSIDVLLRLLSLGTVSVYALPGQRTITDNGTLRFSETLVRLYGADITVPGRQGETGLRELSNT